MVADWFGFIAVYLVVGLLICWTARKGWPEDWDEALLASVLGPPLFALLATAFAANLVRTRLVNSGPDSQNRGSAA
jgi:hypothetical protein